MMKILLVDDYFIFPEKSKIGIGRNELSVFVKRYNNADENMKKYMLEPDYLEQICIGDTSLDDKYYNKIISNITIKLAKASLLINLGNLPLIALNAIYIKYPQKRG